MSHAVKAVMFIGDGFSALTQDGLDRQRQLHATIDLLQFANAYILNDVTIIGGKVLQGRYEIGGADDDPLASFINAKLEASKGLEVVGFRSVDATAPAFHDLTPLWKLTDPDQFSSEIKQLRKAADDANEAVFDVPGSQKANAEDALRQARNAVWEVETRARVRQMQTYLLMADQLAADFVPEYYYGVGAVLEYPTLLKELHASERRRREFHPAFREFSDKLIARMAAPVEFDHLELLRQPNFLVEALRHTESFDKLGKTLDQLREGAAAKSYRELNRARLYADNPKARSEAENEIKAGIDERFQKDGFKSRIPSFTKTLTGLSAQGLALLFPPLKLVSDGLDLLFEGADWLDRLLRRRRSPFLAYFADTSNLYDEVLTKFPGIRFSREQLAAQLAKRRDALLPLIGKDRRELG